MSRWVYEEKIDRINVINRILKEKEERNRGAKKRTTHYSLRNARSPVRLAQAGLLRYAKKCRQLGFAEAVVMIVFSRKPSKNKDL